MLQWPDTIPPPRARSTVMYDHVGPNGPLANFLKDFGPAIMQKFKPKGILVFSAHWETDGERLGIVFQGSYVWHVAHSEYSDRLWTVPAASHGLLRLP